MAKDNETPVARGQKPQNFWGTVIRLVRYMSTRAWALLAMVFFAAGAALFAAFTPTVLGWATTEIFDGFTEGMALREAGEVVNVFPIDFDVIGRIVLLLTVLYILEAVFRYLQRYITAVISQRTVYDLRKDLKAKLTNLPIEYFDTHSVGDIMSRAVNDMEQISNALQQSLSQFVLAVVTFFAVLVAMLSVDFTNVLNCIWKCRLKCIIYCIYSTKIAKTIWKTATSRR